MNLKQLLHYEDIKVDKVIWYGVDFGYCFDEKGLVKDKILLESGKKFKEGNNYMLLLGIDGYKARYKGVYKLVKQVQNDDPNPENKKYNCFIIERIEVKMDEYFNRLILFYPKGFAYCTKKTQEFQIYEIEHPYTNRTVASFDNYDNVDLSFVQLQEVMLNNYKDYYNALSSVKGIYMIIDKNSGKQYVGSAFGNDGIWGRWKNYAETFTGGNEAFEQLLKENGQQYFIDNFKYIILQICSFKMSSKEIIELEQKYKKRFNTIDVGYNNN